MKRVSIRDVARRAGVGPATVSRYLNHSGYVSEDTERKIRAAIEALDYTPNELARNLFNNRSGIIAVLVPDSLHPFFSAYVREIESALYENGYRMILCNTERADSEEEKQLFDMLKRHIVDGILTSVHTTANDRAYAEMTQPIVALDRLIGDIPLVASDHEAGGAMAAKLLLEAGCRRVLQFADDADVATPAHLHNTGFERVMREHGAEVINWYSDWNYFTYEYYRDSAARAFDAYPDVDGVYGTDLYAIYFMQRALQAGRRVPDDLRVIAYDGTPLTRMFTPAITAIVQPVRALARAAVGLLIRDIEGEYLRGERVILDLTLQRGGTL